MNASVTEQQGSVALLLAAAESASLSEFLPRAREAFARSGGVASITLAIADSGQWKVVASTLGEFKVALPVDLLAHVLDAGEPSAARQWVALPHKADRIHSEVFLLAAKESQRGDALLPTVVGMAAAFEAALALVREKEQTAHRVERLEAILKIAGRWDKSGNLEPLLVDLAEAATRLLKADRASIFLWDRANHTLVGRPALGMPDNELRIADDSGIVGQVVQTGQSRRAGSALDEREINRSVDRSSGYQTRTLVCVPLRSSKGEVFGAFEGINKLQGTFSEADEVALAELAQHAARAIEATQEFEQLLNTRRTLVDQAAERVQMIGESPAMVKLRGNVERVANTELAVLIQGENGTGKEVVAESIHYQSRRRSQPFIAVNCAAIAETLLESELFGHEKGAFTDACETRIGKFELAGAGTLFLDEIGDLSAAGQAKLLRVLEDKVVVRVGGSRPIPTEARVLAATNQDLPTMVRDKRFRQDLYFRLNVVTLELPPLRDRGEDVLLLAEHYLSQFGRRAKRKSLKLSHAARQKLLRHAWPGNVRELRNLMERVAYLTNSDTIEVEDLGLADATGGADGLMSVSGSQQLAQATDEFQAAYIKQMIARARGNMSDAAERLGLHRSNLYRKMRQLGMETREE